MGRLEGKTAFSGLPRAETVIPVRYPQASRPQAWSSGAPLLAMRTLLGLDADDGELRAAPHVPGGWRFSLRRVPFRGERTGSVAA